ncbi:MAG: hypothetical protein NWF07_05810 [Candidatus Bathyarchaeota archaeon]|nr:hypothetical protein [Candidatus Bathyarchaeota archaeon]
MKTMKKIGLALTLAVLLTTFALPVASAEPISCGDSVTLWAGQHIDAGSVTVSNDEDYIYVTYSTNDPWVLTETHLDIELQYLDFPMTKKGSPKVGNFAYQMTHDPAVTEYTYEIPMDQAWWDQGTVVIAAHAVVMVFENGEMIEEETGWAEGGPFGKSWATYFEYTICKETPPPPPQEYGTETAFAYGRAYANDFLENGFNRWGWTNGPLDMGVYNFPIYAGAGQSDITKGTYVGDLLIFYDGYMMFVDYVMHPGYFMLETHLYVGTEMFPTLGGEPTVAPGQYSYIHGDLPEVMHDGYIVSGLSGPVYVIAHATVGNYLWD